MATRISDEDYEKLNPGQENWDEKVNGLKDAEENGNFNSDSTSNNSSDNNTSGQDSGKKTKQEEENPEFINKYTNLKESLKIKQGENLSRSKALIRLGRRKGPITAIVLTVAGGGLGLSALLSPGLLLVHMKETVFNKFNSQLTSMDYRSTKMLAKKMRTTKGICTSVLTVKCKYSSMSKKQIARFEKAGIKVTYGDEGNTVFGRKKPISFEFEGETIPANQFNDRIKNNPKFRSALHKAYNPKFAGFADNIFRKVTTRFRTTKSRMIIEGETDESRLKSIQQVTEEGVDSKRLTDTDNLSKPALDENGNEIIDKDGNKVLTDVDDKTLDDAKNYGNDIADNTDDIKKTGVKALNTFGDAASSAIKITGIADNVCTAYGMIKAVGYAAKTIRAIQLVRYAMLFLNVADQMKAGDAKAEDVAYLGTILTTEVLSTIQLNNTYKKVSRTATDSFGYKFAAFGEKGKTTPSAMQFLAGGGLTGALINLPAQFNSWLGGAPKNICGTLKNPFVSGASTIAGIVLMIIPGVNVAMVVKLAGQAAIGIALSALIAEIPNLLKNIIAGVLIDKNTVGEFAGDAFVSGSSGTMGETAKFGGNSPLTPNQAVAYNSLSNQVIAKYAEEDRLTYSPFDITNQNTFIGSIVSKLVPFLSKTASLSALNIFTSISSITTKSLASLSPITKAEDVSDYTMCTDFDYTDPNGDGNYDDKIATDPFCNVTYGVPIGNLDIDSDEVLDKMNGQIIDNVKPERENELGQPIPDGEYAKFIENCIERTRPIGDSGDDFQQSDGSECILNDTNKTKYPNYKYYYLYYIDQRVENGMDGIDETLNAAMDSGIDDNIAFYNGDNTSYNTIGYDDIDYSDISIASEIDYEDQPTINSVTPVKKPTITENQSINHVSNTNICKMSDITNKISDFGYLCDYSKLTFNTSGGI